MLLTLVSVGRMSLTLVSVERMLLTLMSVGRISLTLVVSGKNAPYIDGQWEEECSLHWCQWEECPLH
ncbi:unnamed protein product, partial [Staurois parvus]